MAEKLRQVGVPVERHNHEGATHEFFGMAPVAADPRTAQDFPGERLRAALGTGSRVSARCSGAPASGDGPAGRSPSRAPFGGSGHSPP